MQASDIINQIEEAAKTLRRLPSVKARGYSSYWPPIIRDFWESYALEPEPLKLIPTARQITRLDQVNDWLSWLDQEARTLVWLSCSGVSFRKLQNILGRPKSTLNVNFHYAIMELSWRITHRRPKRLDVPAVIEAHRNMIIAFQRHHDPRRNYGRRADRLGA